MLVTRLLSSELYLLEPTQVQVTIYRSTSTYKCISLQSVYITSQIGLIPFPGRGFTWLGNLALAVTGLCHDNMGYVRNWLQKTSRFREVSSDHVWTGKSVEYMMKLNRGLPVWQKPKDISQIISSLWKGNNNRSESNNCKITAKPNPTVPRENHNLKVRKWCTYLSWRDLSWIWGTPGISSLGLYNIDFMMTPGFRYNVFFFFFFFFFLNKQTYKKKNKTKQNKKTLLPHICFVYRPLHPMSGIRMMYPWNG